MGINNDGVNLTGRSFHDTSWSIYVICHLRHSATVKLRKSPYPTKGDSPCSNPGKSFSPVMERLQGSHSILRLNDSRGVLLLWDGTTPRESFCPRMERLKGGHSVLGWNDSRGVILSWDGTTPGESFSPGMKRLQRRHSVFGWNDSSKVFLSRDGTTLGDSIHPFIQSWDETTPEETFCLWMERLQGSQS